MKAKEQDVVKGLAWWEHVQTLDARQMVFLDECGVNTAMHRNAPALWSFTQRHALPGRCAAQLEKQHNHPGRVVPGALSLARCPFKVFRQ